MYAIQSGRSPILTYKMYAFFASISQKSKILINNTGIFMLNHMKETVVFIRTYRLIECTQSKSG